MTGARAALIFGALLLAGMTANLIMVRSDAAHLDRLETVEQPSAVGDTNYAPNPDVKDVGKVETTMHGRPLVITEEKVMDENDGTMIRAGSDDRGFVLYRSTREKNGQLLYPDMLFLKVKDDQFLSLRLAHE